MYPAVAKQTGSGTEQHDPACGSSKGTQCAGNTTVGKTGRGKETASASPSTGAKQDPHHDDVTGMMEIVLDGQSFEGKLGGLVVPRVALAYIVEAAAGLGGAVVAAGVPTIMCATISIMLNFAAMAQWMAYTTICGYRLNHADPYPMVHNHGDMYRRVSLPFGSCLLSAVLFNCC